MSYNHCRLSMYMADENITHASGKPWEALKFAIGAGDVLIHPVHAWATTTSFLLYLAVMFWPQ